MSSSGNRYSWGQGQGQVIEGEGHVNDTCGYGDNVTSFTNIDASSDIPVRHLSDIDYKLEHLAM